MVVLIILIFDEKEKVFSKGVSMQHRTSVINSIQSSSTAIHVFVMLQYPWYLTYPIWSRHSSVNVVYQTRNWYLFSIQNIIIETTISGPSENVSRNEGTYIYLEVFDSVCLFWYICSMFIDKRLIFFVYFFINLKKQLRALQDNKLVQFSWIFHVIQLSLFWRPSSSSY